MHKHRRKPASANRETTTRLEVKEPAELLAFLLERLPSRGRNAVKALLPRGQVTVDGRAATRHNHPLEAGQTVVVTWGKAAAEIPFIGLRILHEDDDLLVVDKEAGLLSIASPQEKELTAYRQLMRYVRRQHPKNRVFVVHRLDRDTSGVMLFAKSADVQQKLQSAWQETVAERTYAALVEGAVKQPEGTVSSWLKESKTLIMYSGSRPNDGQYAVTHYRIIRSSGEYTLLEVRLETGRKNQIRVHMQDLGHPVVGDKKYGSRKNPIGRLGLHARVLAFHHPNKPEEILRFESDIPSSFTRVFGG